MALNFPTNPNPGDTYESWQYNGSSWEPVTSLDLTFTQNGTGAVERQLVDKVREKVSVMDFGAAGNGFTDDTAAIQNAINYAESLSVPQSPSILAPNYIEVDLLGKAYAITGTLIIDKSIKFTNGRLIALPSFTSPNGFMIEILGGAEDCLISDLFLDGGLTEDTPGTPGTFTRHANLIWVQCRQVSIVRCKGIHFPAYGIRVGDINSPVEQFAKSASLIDCSMSEWRFGEDGREYPQLKTARGFSLESFQGTMNRCDASQTKYPVYMDCSSWYVSQLKTFNGQEPGDNGGNLTDNQIGVFINRGYNALDSCTFGSGYVHINGDVSEGADLAPSRTTISNSEFIQYNTTADAHILYETDQANDTCFGLVVTNNRFGNGNSVDPIIFNAVGSGSLVPDIDKNITWVGNVDFFDSAINTSLGFKTKFGSGIQFNGGDITCETINSYQPKYVLKDNITLTVGPDPEHDFQQINQAVIYLRDFSIPPGGNVFVDISNGNYASPGSLDFSHHDGQRITYRAANGLVTPGDVPIRTDFIGDYTTDYATVSAKYNTIIDCERSGALVRDSSVKIQDILFRYVGEPFDDADPYDGLNLINSRARVIDCTFWGFPNHGVTGNYSYISSSGMCVAYNDNQNYRLVENSTGVFSGTESLLLAVSGNNSVTLNHSSSLQASRVDVLSANDTGFTVQGSSSNYIASTSGSEIDYSYYIDGCKTGINVNHSSFFKAASATIINIEQSPVVSLQGSYVKIERVLDASSTSNDTTFVVNTNSTIYLTDSQAVSANFTYSIDVDQHQPGYTYGFEPPKGTIHVLTDS